MAKRTKTSINHIIGNTINTEEIINKLLQEPNEDHIFIKDFINSNNQLNMLLENLLHEEKIIKMFIFKKLVCYYEKIPDIMKDDYIIEDKYVNNILSVLCNEKDEEVKVKIMKLIYFLFIIY